jgi:hypothetical protein
LEHQVGPTPWNGLIRSLQFAPSYLTQFQLQIDWISTGQHRSSLCRTVAVSGLTLGQFDLYLSDTSGGTAPVTVLAKATDIQSKRASAGCAVGATNTYTFYAGGLAPGTYRVIATPSGGVTPIAVSVHGLRRQRGADICRDVSFGGRQHGRFRSDSTR